MVTQVTWHAKFEDRWCIYPFYSTLKNQTTLEPVWLDYDSEKAAVKCEP